VLVSFFPMKGFLGTGAPFGADLNLVVQLIMGLALIAGVLLAKQKRYTAHGICQTTVLLLNLLMIELVMWPSFQQQVKPALSKVLHKWYYEAATIHALLGIKRWKLWMRTELVLWAIVLVSGVGTYCAWYLAPFR
jgi:Ca2+/H+ antiporter